MYVDSREKVTARYQVISATAMNYTFVLVLHDFLSFLLIILILGLFCFSHQLTVPSKREMMVFGSFKQTGTLLPKFPKGWGWRTALLFDELADLLQNGALRVIAVVQLV